MVKCPLGKIVRKEYIRSDGTRVKATCVPDKGKPGKTKASKKVLPKPVPGNLGKYGYKDIKSLSASERHSALEKGVKDAGYATIIRRINLIANYNKNSDPKVHKLMRSDIKWIQDKLACEYALSPPPRCGKKGSRKGSKKSSRKTSKKSSRRASKKSSRRASKKSSRRASKKSSRKSSKKPSTMRGALKELTKDKLLKLSKKHYIEQKKSSTKSEIISKITRNLNKSKVMKAVKQFS